MTTAAEIAEQILALSHQLRLIRDDSKEHHDRRAMADVFGALLFEIAQPYGADLRDDLAVLDISGDTPAPVFDANLKAVFERHSVPCSEGLARVTSRVFTGVTGHIRLPSDERYIAWALESPVELILHRARTYADDGNGVANQAWWCSFVNPPGWLRGEERRDDLRAQVSKTFRKAWKLRDQTGLTVVATRGQSLLLDAQFPPAAAAGPSDTNKRILTRDEIMTATNISERLDHARTDRVESDFVDWLLESLPAGGKPSRGRLPSMDRAAHWWALRELAKWPYERIAHEEHPLDVTHLVESMPAAVYRLRQLCRAQGKRSRR